MDPLLFANSSILSKTSKPSKTSIATVSNTNIINQNSNHVIVYDDRQINEFAGVSFSLYKRSQVKKKLLETLTNGAIEEANYWGAELVCCGCFLELWEILLEFLGRNINTSNPKLPVIIEKCFQNFKELALGNDFLTDQLEMRNSPRVRKIVAEVISILCLSRKKSKLDYVKIDKENDFDILKLSSRLKASSSVYGEKVLKNEDPTEVHVAINEFCYHLSKDVRNSLMSQYWIEWLIYFDKLCRKKKERCQCIRRDFAPDDESGKDIIFLIWDAILTEAKKRNQKILIIIITSLLNLFKIKYSAPVVKRRRHLLYFAVNLLCEPLDLMFDPIQCQTSLKSILQNIDIVYSQVKKGEVSSATVQEARAKLEEENRQKNKNKNKEQDAKKTKKEQDAEHKLNILTTMGVDNSL